MPIWPGKGYSVNADWDKEILHTLHTTKPYSWIVKNPKGFRFSYFVEYTTIDNYQIDPEKLGILKEISRFVVGDKLKFRDPWIGFRPMSVDNLPIIGKFPNVDNVFLNTGHGSRGSIYSFGSAKLISEIVLGKKTSIDSRFYDPGRFWI